MIAQAIDTRYRGYLFRSRLEARWAVYFDAIGLRWEYEREGFASEYFEHHELPVKHLIELLEVSHPRLLVIANSFGARSIGHFDSYYDENGNFVSGVGSTLRCAVAAT